MLLILAHYQMIIIVFCFKLKEMIDFCLLKETQFKKMYLGVRKILFRGKILLSRMDIKYPCINHQLYFQILQLHSLLPEPGGRLRLQQLHRAEPRLLDGI